MKITKEIWSINELIEKRTIIDPKPQYQRTAVWTVDRKAFLIDSILREYDLPKFYFTFNKNKNAKGFEFEVADGQQRIRSILEYKDDLYKLKKDTKIDGFDLSMMSFSELPEKFQHLFLNYEIHITNILSYDSNEVNDLFTRLQKGVSLNPPELRHAMLSNIGIYIDKYVTKQQSNGFFSQNTKIKDTRFKHQELIDHVIALIHYKNSKDLKAATMAQLYIDFAEMDQKCFSDYFKNANKVLQIMTKINKYKNGIFKNKWAFVDYFWFFYRNLHKINNINHFEFSKLAITFEKDRLNFNPEPQKLLSNNHQLGELLFKYIQAFNKEGANKENIRIRSEVLDSVFENLL